MEHIKYALQLVCLWLVWSEKNRTISSSIISLISKSSIWERNDTWKNYLFSFQWIFVSFSLQFNEQFLKILQCSWRVISPSAGTEVPIITVIFLGNCPFWFIAALFHSAREWRAIQRTFMLYPVLQSYVDKKCWKSA